MESKNKFFRCYFCKTKNNYFVPAEENGKECKCCQAFNYFQENIDNNYNNYNYNKKKKGYKFKKFHNKDNRAKKIEFNSNGKFGGTQNNFYKKNYNNFNNELNGDINRKTNIFSHGINSSINNISNHNNNNINLNYNDFLNTQPCPFATINNNNFLNEINLNTFNNNPYHRQNHQNPKYNLKRDNFKPKPKRNSHSFIKNFYYKEVFHYKCIEEVIDHHMNACPNCRCNLKTGEKQKNYDKNITYNNLLNLNYLRIPFDGNSFFDSNENNDYDISDDYDDAFDLYDF